MPKNNIHPTALVHENAKIGDNVKVGPYCIIGEKVVIGDNTVLHSHVVVECNASIGQNVTIFPFVSMMQPQDLKYKGENSKLVIGDKCVIREHATLQPGTEGGGMLTEIGNECLLMVGSHVAHDCKVGNNVIMANNATLAGHVEVGDFAIIGGLSAVHQFVRIGHHAMIGGMSGIENDVIPFGEAMGERANLCGLNLIGLKRRGFERSDIKTLRSAYRLLFSPEGTLAERIKDVEERFEDSESVKDVMAFIKSDSQRSICQPSAKQKQSDAKI